MNARRVKPASRQTGAMLLEALIAILIFSMGILAIVGLQAAAIKNANDAMYRTNASLLANELIGHMWVSNRTVAAMQANFSSPGGAAYTDWLTNVQATLPGVTATANLPTVNIAANGTVTIGIFWKLPSEPAGMAAHTYIAVAQIQ
jgi:type IV pilus assembly protein PilV